MRGSHGHDGQSLSPASAPLSLSGCPGFQHTMSRATATSPVLELVEFGAGGTAYGISETLKVFMKLFLQVLGNQRYCTVSKNNVLGHKLNRRSRLPCLMNALRATGKFNIHLQ